MIAAHRLPAVGCSNSVIDAQMFRCVRPLLHAIGFHTTVLIATSAALCNRMLGDDMYKKFRRFSALNFAEDNKLSWCPNKDCQHGFLPADPEAKVLHCNACQVGCLRLVRPYSTHCWLVTMWQRDFCRNCNLLPHDGPCPDKHDLAGLSESERCGPLTSGVLADRRLALVCRASYQLILSSTKACPRCEIRIIKDQGCNVSRALDRVEVLRSSPPCAGCGDLQHMTCSRCKFEWCWIHLTEWKVPAGFVHPCCWFAALTSRSLCHRLAVLVSWAIGTITA